MPTRVPRPVPSVLAALLLSACSSRLEPSSCGTDATCPPASRCQSSVCVAGSRPVAAIRPLEPVAAFALVDLDGSDSRAPDPGGEIVEHVWTARAITARCAAPEIAGRTAIARVRFGCPGRYEVSLTVRDTLSLESEQATVAVDVVPSSLPSAVTAGPDLSTEHACSGEPLVCRPVDPIALTASIAAPGLSVRWTVEPPLDRPLADGTRRVALSGSDTAPVASIETDGTAISGDWIFRVEAYDEAGVVGAAYTRVSIRNRPPTVVAGPVTPFPHAFDAARSLFTSAGEIAFAASDPDGDPLELEPTWRHVGDGGGTFAGALRGGSATFSLEVPYGEPADALFLRGGPDLARTIEIAARDPNRAEGRAVVAVEVGNRAPELVGGVVDTRVPHRYDASRSRYVASARVGTWADPDGDPLSIAPGAAPCEAFSLDAEGLRVECSVPYEGTPAVHRIAGRRSVPVLLRDPWTGGSTVPVYSVEILDAPPSLSVTISPGTLACEWKGWVTFALGGASFDAFPQVSDPDGDPLLLTALPIAGGSASPQLAICTSGCVPFHFFQPAQTFSLQPRLSALTASDGALSVTATSAPPFSCVL